MKRWKMIAGLWLTGAVVICLGKPAGFTGFSANDISSVHAANERIQLAEKGSDLQEQIEEAEAEQEDLENKKEKLEKAIDRIQKVTGDVVKYVESLDYQLNSLNSSIISTEETIANLEEEVETVNEELEVALDRRMTHYETMKDRIQYIYENSSNNYLEYILESKSLADLFSREEYVEKITNYDNTLLTEYQMLLNEVTIAQADAERKLDEMELSRENLKYEKKTVKRLMKEKNRQVKIYQGMLESSQENLSDYAAQIAEQEQKVEALLQQQREKIAAGEDTVIPTTGEYAWPLTVSGRITSNFGYRTAPTAGASSYHKGVDIAASVGTPILATKDGKVVTSTYSASAGNYIGIYHGGGVYSYYMHCSTLSAKVGDKVKKGQVIATVGSTGISTGPHLHFAIYKGGAYVNPMYYVSQP